jgi:hypothetical protein
MTEAKSMMILERAFEPISLTPLSIDKDKRELRIHGIEPHGKADRTTHLTAHEMRLLAYRLLAEAEVVSPSK